MTRLAGSFSLAIAGLVVSMLVSRVAFAGEDLPLGLVLVDHGIGAAISEDGTRIALAASEDVFEYGEEGYERHLTTVSIRNMKTAGAPVIWTGVVACTASGDVPADARCSAKAIAKARKDLVGMLSKVRHGPLLLKTPPPLAGKQEQLEGERSRPTNWTVLLKGRTDIELVIGVNGARVSVSANSEGKLVFTGDVEAASSEPGIDDGVTADVLATSAPLALQAGVFVLTSRSERPGSRSLRDTTTWHFVPFAGLEPEEVRELARLVVRPMDDEPFPAFRARLPRSGPERKWIAATEKIIKKHCGQLRDLYAVQIKFQNTCQGTEVYKYRCKPRELAQWQRKLDSKKGTAAATLAMLRPLNTEAYSAEYFGSVDAYVAFLTQGLAYYCPSPPANPWFQAGGSPASE